MLASLFNKGSHFVSSPLHIRYLSIEGITSSPLKVAFSVPKKRFKNATDRNRIKRQLREVYRLNKHHLVPNLIQSNTCLHCLIIYSSNEPPTFNQLEQAFTKLIDYFNSRL